jgi:hypothetical protein
MHLRERLRQMGRVVQHMIGDHDINTRRRQRQLLRPRPFGRGSYRLAPVYQPQGREWESPSLD